MERPRPPRARDVAATVSGDLDVRRSIAGHLRAAPGPDLYVLLGVLREVNTRTIRPPRIRKSVSRGSGGGDDEARVDAQGFPASSGNSGCLRAVRVALAPTLAPGTGRLEQPDLERHLPVGRKGRPEHHCQLLFCGRLVAPRRDERQDRLRQQRERQRRCDQRPGHARGCGSPQHRLQLRSQGHGHRPERLRSRTGDGDDHDLLLAEHDDPPVLQQDRLRHVHEGRRLEQRRPDQDRSPGERAGVMHVPRLGR